MAKKNEVPTEKELADRKELLRAAVRLRTQAPGKPGQSSEQILGDDRAR